TLKDTNDPLGFLMETQNMLARGRLDLPISLWFAPLRGDDLLLRKLLKLVLDANKSGNNDGVNIVLLPGTDEPYTDVFGSDSGDGNWGGSNFVVDVPKKGARKASQRRQHLDLSTT
ncbi:hypothetical protein Tco_1296915, partial [Tanacetum coccineum]